jgi:2-polyprenyl-3-methyl-5-hydroxy-6-metoxy-1,4-benzoquinol methylase
MNYTDVYTMAFSNKQYSNDHHIQYNYVIEELKLMFKLDDQFEVIDIGSGRGQMINAIQANFKNAIITSVDLERFNTISGITFIQCDLSKAEDRNKLLLKKYDVVVSTDVLEHLDISFITEVIELFSKLSNKSILAIANHSDVWNGIELHTIQGNSIWWMNLLNKYFKLQKFESIFDDILYLFRVNTLTQK